MRTLLIIALIFTSFFASAQEFRGATRKRLLNISVVKTGPYLGLQRGKYWVAEIGAERQWKQIRLSNAVTHAAHMGFNYNFPNNVLGYDIGYWIKPHRIGLTYGGNLFFRTDFDRNKVGIAPVIGFKFWLLHFQTGYHFIPRLGDFETNTFFVSLRVGIINDRDIKINRDK